MDEYNWNKIIYESEYSFQPIIGQVYHLYQKRKSELLVEHRQSTHWNKKFIGSFRLLTNGKWEEVKNDVKKVPITGAVEP